MKKNFLIFVLFIFFSGNVFSAPLSEALLQAYNENPVLNAERENIQVSLEEVKISKSQFLPSVTLSGSKSQENTEKQTDSSGANSAFTDVDPKTQSIDIEQKLFQGFAGTASLEKSKIGLTLAQAKLLKTEQEILYQAIEAYTGLIFAEEKLKINQDNVNLLERQVETDQARLERGQITLSDLSQSESSLAGAQAKFLQAQNETVTAKLNYEKIIGPIADINSLDKESDLNFALPVSLNEAIEISKKDNPNLIISRLEYEQSEKDMIIARSDLSPSASLSFNSSKSDDVSSTIGERDKEILKATISWPIFNGGKNYASLNKSKNLKNRKKLLLDNALKSNDTNVASAWSNFQVSKSLLNSVTSQVKAAEIANEGITVEYESGLGRSTLDVIQSNSILLNAKISLADSERNYLLSQFKLLQSVGYLNSKYLKLQ
ncbi:MAG: TolC family outer membrane protein [Candidatus Pelagibacter bacterium]|jgi:outer membrane protein|nr:TolC family outer membrane protein [Pelagibacteraceae bacterium]MDF1857936.1 TolC family outer membrane protein [Candidatus Pelagibacter bacterium]